MIRALRPQMLSFALSGRGQIDLPAVCRQAGWVALWRRMGQQSVLARKVSLFS